MLAALGAAHAAAQTIPPAQRAGSASPPARPGSTPWRVAMPAQRISSVRRPAAPAWAGEPEPAARRPLLDWQPSLQFREEFSDNFEFSNEETRSNWRTTVSPQLALSAGRGAARAALDLRADVLGDSVRDRWHVQPELSSQLSWRVSSRLDLRVENQFFQSDDPSRADTLGLRGERELFRRNLLYAQAQYRHPALGAGLSYRRPSFALRHGDRTRADEFGLLVQKSFGSGTTASVLYEELRSRTDGSERSSRRAGPRWSGALTRNLPRWGSAGLAGSYTALQTQRGPQQTARLWTVLPYVQFDRSRELRASLAAGWSELERRPGRSHGRLNALGALQFARGPWTVDVSAAHGFAETYSDGEDAGIVAALLADVSLSYRIAPRARLSLSRSYRENDFLSLQGPVPGRTEHQRGARLALYLDLGRSLEAAFELGFEERDSPRRDRTYSLHRIQARISSRFE